MYLRLSGWLLFSVVIFFITGCGSINPFSEDDPGVRAFYVDRQEAQRIDFNTIQVTSSREDLVRLVSNTIEEVTGESTNILHVQNQNDERGAFTSDRPFMRIVSPRIEIDDREDFLEYFYLGHYLLENPDYDVRAEDFYYQIEAILSLSGHDFKVEFSVNAGNEWRIYKHADGDLQQIPENQHVKYGVGSYRYEETVEQINWRGNPIETTEWVYVDIDDTPQTRGSLENELVNTMMEHAAHDRIPARVSR